MGSFPGGVRDQRPRVLLGVILTPKPLTLKVVCVKRIRGAWIKSRAQGLELNTAS